MHKKFWKSLTLFVLILTAFSFIEKKESNIYWAKGYQLSWDDFQGNAPSDHVLGASSTVSPGVNWTIKNNLLVIDSRSYFDKTKSWSKPSERTSELLMHEQGHFDIGEIYARKFRRHLEDARFSSKSVKLKLGGIANEVFSEFEKFQNAYDKETNHSKNVKKQMEWNIKIKTELGKLQKYNMTKRIERLQ